MRPDSHGTPGPTQRTPRGWQAVSLSVSLPAAPQSRRVSHTASSVDRGPGWLEVLTLRGWGRWAAGGSAVPAGARACAPASRTGCVLVPQQGSQASFCPAPAGDTAPEAADQGQRGPSCQGSHSCCEQSLAVPSCPALACQGHEEAQSPGTGSRRSPASQIPADHSGAGLEAARVGQGLPPSLGLHVIRLQRTRQGQASHPWPARPPPSARLSGSLSGLSQGSQLFAETLRSLPLGEGLGQGWKILGSPGPGKANQFCFHFPSRHPAPVVPVHTWAQHSRAHGESALSLGSLRVTVDAVQDKNGVRFLLPRGSSAQGQGGHGLGQSRWSGPQRSPHCPGTPSKHLGEAQGPRVGVRMAAVLPNPALSPAHPTGPTW